jgi:hypothetical protein
MAWDGFHDNIEITAGGTSYVLPVGNLEVMAEPYARAGSTSVELFDGRRVQRVDGWRLTAEISFDELTPAQHSTFFDMIVAVAAEAGVDINFDPNGAGKTVSSDWILSDAESALQAVFERGIRGRPASVTFVTKGVLAAPPSWLTS